MKRMACGGLALTSAGTILSACASDLIEAEEEHPTPTAARAPSHYLPTEEGLWTLPVAHKGDLPSGTGALEIEQVGKFSFEAERVTTVRPDIFQPGHFSLFDVLVHLSERGDLALDYHFDETMDTHVIDALDGEGGWWHNAYYSAGWFEPNVFRMDMYPYKNNMRIRLARENEGRLEAIRRGFQEEVDRLKANGGQVVIPDVGIRAPSGRLAFQDVVVRPHDVRTDVLQPGVVTALDAMISLAEQGELPELKLTWYERIAGADPVDSYWVEKLSEDVAVGGCGFVYETGPRSFSGFSGTHIHIPADVRVTIAPEYALWFWICLGRGGL
jgi:hypothetical protein